MAGKKRKSAVKPNVYEELGRCLQFAGIIARYADRESRMPLGIPSAVTLFLAKFNIVRQAFRDLSPDAVLGIGAVNDNRPVRFAGRVDVSYLQLTMTLLADTHVAINPRILSFDEAGLSPNITMNETNLAEDWPDIVSRVKAIWSFNRSELFVELLCEWRRAWKLLGLKNTTPPVALKTAEELPPIYHGGGVIEFFDGEKITLTGNQAEVFDVVATKGPLVMNDLIDLSHCQSAVAVWRSIFKSFPRLNAWGEKAPGRNGGGYRVQIRLAG